MGDLKRARITIEEQITIGNFLKKASRDMALSRVVQEVRSKIGKEIPRQTITRIARAHGITFKGSHSYRVSRENRRILVTCPCGHKFTVSVYLHRKGETNGQTNPTFELQPSSPTLL
jgi:hypothetical protein